MKTILYVFSGTGNTLAAAKDLSAKLSGDTEIRSVVSYVKRPVEISGADRIGFIFPVYAWGLPEIVRRFALSLNIPKNTYLFSIATCGGTPGGTNGQFDKLLRTKGHRLSAGFTVAFASGNLGMENKMITMVRKLAGTSSRKWADRINQISSIIEKQEKLPLEQNNIQTRITGNFFSTMATKMFAELDKNFAVSDRCNGCATCSRICPVDNITITNSKPSWNHHCQQCLACIHWCPQAAIELGESSVGKARYHNPGVTLNELIGLKS